MPLSAFGYYWPATTGLILLLIVALWACGTRSARQKPGSW